MDHLDELVKGLRKIHHRFAHRRRSDTSANETICCDPAIAIR